MVSAAVLAPVPGAGAAPAAAPATAPAAPAAPAAAALPPVVPASNFDEGGKDSTDLCQGCYTESKSKDDYIPVRITFERST